MTQYLRDRVADRADFRCEYCKLPHFTMVVPFEIDHIIAEKHDGQTEPENLAYACINCNGFKGPNTAGIDRESGEIVRLYNPRTDYWSKNFEWNGPKLIAKSPIGSATIAVLRINEPDQLELRRLLILEGIISHDPIGFVHRSDPVRSYLTSPALSRISLCENYS